MAIDKEKMIRDMLGHLKNDTEISLVDYKANENIVVVGVNPVQIRPQLYTDNDALAAYVGDKMQKIGSQIAKTNHSKYFNRMVSADEFMFYFQPKFIERGTFMKIADECWSRENPLYSN